MVDFGEELVIVDSYRIPWLIWIQMLVFFLLLLLLCALGILSPDLYENNPSSSSSSASSSSGASVPRRFPLGDPVPADCGSKFFGNSSLVQSNQMGGGSESIKGEITPCTSSSTGGEGSTRNSYHPCSLFQIARSAFLKCLGLDPTSSDDSRRPEPKKQL
ncbi:PREDICTED: uncharacterized protein LOC104799256 [Tarenaya hassleriana]|uniref:uncharacterized protein LOC104799256 n=1 Tax=Tarenaya hassleriana TaxID=28532 RepID=UPI00053C28C8|nr:PREDICTED: uncharacterized protein LOC104799256 [Tarenaya hassleriana]